MDAKYYDRGELSIGNPPLVDLVRKLGGKDLPETEPTTLSAMAYEIARGVPGAVFHHPKNRNSFGPFLEGVGDQRRVGRQPCGESRLAALSGSVANATREVMS